MTRPTLSLNPCRVVGCGATVRNSTKECALCRACRDLSYAEFRRLNQGLSPSEWQHRLNAFHGDPLGRVALAQAARAERAAA